MFSILIAFAGCNIRIAAAVSTAALQNVVVVIWFFMRMAISANVGFVE